MRIYMTGSRGRELQHHLSLFLSLLLRWWWVLLFVWIFHGLRRRARWRGLPFSGVARWGYWIRHRPKQEGRHSVWEICRCIGLSSVGQYRLHIKFCWISFLWFLPLPTLAPTVLHLIFLLFWPESFFLLFFAGRFFYSTKENIKYGTLETIHLGLALLLFFRHPS